MLFKCFVLQWFFQNSSVRQRFFHLWFSLAKIFSKNVFRSTPSIVIDLFTWWRKCICLDRDKFLFFFFLFDCQSSSFRSTLMNKYLFHRNIHQLFNLINGFISIRSQVNIIMNRLLMPLLHQVMNVRRNPLHNYLQGQSFSIESETEWHFSFSSLIDRKRRSTIVSFSSSTQSIFIIVIVAME